MRLIFNCLCFSEFLFILGGGFFFGRVVMKNSFDVYCDFFKKLVLWYILKFFLVFEWVRFCVLVGDCW